MALAIALEHAARAQTQGRILGVIYASRASLRPPSGGAFALGGSGLSLARTGPARRGRRTGGRWPSQGRWFDPSPAHKESHRRQGFL